MSTVLSVETDIQAKTLSMNDIRLPGPESRIVVFAGTVFKLKYKLSSTNAKEVQQEYNGKLPLIQEDIKGLTAAVLNQVCRTAAPVPVRTDRVIVFPEVLPWDRINQLEFSYSNSKLVTHPNIIFMLIYLPPSPTTPKKAIVLGKHMLGVSTPPKKKWLKSSEDKEMGYPHKMVKVECSEEESIDEAETEEFSSEAYLPMASANGEEYVTPSGGSKGNFRSENHYDNAPEVDDVPRASILRRIIRYILGW